MSLALCLVTVLWGFLTLLMYLALAAYATYVINAGQFILKLRAARLDHEARLRELAPAGRAPMMVSASA